MADGKARKAEEVTGGETAPAPPKQIEEGKPDAMWDKKPGAPEQFETTATEHHMDNPTLTE